ncbi:MAG: ABC transporter substrate-binding protein [Desulfomonile tiedjei]|uniref:ABC transporter substrate-binding protein n=1 Tax=Desulfomonile tiedjei TaxID=2358 RepID=A0A9D6V0P2_9BACT|nr:ABC transporter substrate-binding protein [Desulfomonile tiedjei]
MKIFRSALAMSLALVSCQAWAQDTVHIGILLPMSGSFAAGGHSLWEGIKIANKMEPTVLGRSVELKLADTKSDTVEATTAAFSLTEKAGVAAIIGEMVSSNTIAAAFHAERRRIPLVTPTATSGMVTSGKTYVFRICPVDDEQARVAADLALHNLGARTAALICDISQEYSVGLAACFRNEFNRAGGSTVVETRIRTGDRDFTAQINRIKAASPDVIYAPVYYMECGLMAQQARLMGVDAPIIAGDAVEAPELVKFGGRSVENLLFTSHFHEDSLDTEIGKKFRNIFLEETGKRPQASESLGAEAYLVVLDAIRRAGSVNPEMIREALATISNDGGFTSTMLIRTGGNGPLPVLVNEIKNGKFVCVSPPVLELGAGKLRLSDRVSP